MFTYYYYDIIVIVDKPPQSLSPRHQPIRFLGEGILPGSATGALLENIIICIFRRDDV